MSARDDVQERRRRLQELKQSITEEINQIDVRIQSLHATAKRSILKWDDSDCESVSPAECQSKPARELVESLRRQDISLLATRELRMLSRLDVKTEYVQAAHPDGEASTEEQCVWTRYHVEASIHPVPFTMEFLLYENTAGGTYYRDVNLVLKKQYQGTEFCRSDLQTDSPGTAVEWVGRFARAHSHRRAVLDGLEAVECHLLNEGGVRCVCAGLLAITWWIQMMGDKPVRHRFSMEVLQEDFMDEELYEFFKKAHQKLKQPDLTAALRQRVLAKLAKVCADIMKDDSDVTVALPNQVFNGDHESAVIREVVERPHNNKELLKNVKEKSKEIVTKKDINKNTVKDTRDGDVDKRDTNGKRVCEEDVENQQNVEPKKKKGNDRDKKSTINTDKESRNHNGSIQQKEIVDKLAEKIKISNKNKAIIDTEKAIRKDNGALKDTETSKKCNDNAALDSNRLITKGATENTNSKQNDNKNMVEEKIIAKEKSTVQGDVHENNKLSKLKSTKINKLNKDKNTEVTKNKEKHQVITKDKESQQIEDHNKEINNKKTIHSQEKKIISKSIKNINLNKPNNTEVSKNKETEQIEQTNSNKEINNKKTIHFKDNKITSTSKSSKTNNLNKQNNTEVSKNKENPRVIRKNKETDQIEENHSNKENEVERNMVNNEIQMKNIKEINAMAKLKTSKEAQLKVKESTINKVGKEKAQRNLETAQKEKTPINSEHIEKLNIEEKRLTDLFKNDQPLSPIMKLPQHNIITEASNVNFNKNSKDKNRIISSNEKTTKTVINLQSKTMLQKTNKTSKITLKQPILDKATLKPVNFIQKNIISIHGKKSFNPNKEVTTRTSVDNTKTANIKKGSITRTSPTKRFSVISSSTPKRGERFSIIKRKSTVTGDVPTKIPKMVPSFKVGKRSMK